MKALIRSSAVALALIGSIGVAAAQTTIVREELTPTQRTTIYRSITRERVTAPAPNVQVRVGTRVPESVELRAMPETIVTDVPSIKRYRYMYVNGQVVLVDPETSEVVEIIHE
jgi:hypothetical protein